MSGSSERMIGRMIDLGEGAFVSPQAIQSVAARKQRRLYIDDAGHEWPWVVRVETRQQMMLIPCADREAAAATAQRIAAAVNAFFAVRSGSPGGSAKATTVQPATPDQRAPWSSLLPQTLALANGNGAAS